MRVVGIAWRNLVREKARLAMSVSGVAFAVALILLIRGLYAGVTEQATAYIRSVDADVWVAQAGAPGDFFHSVSLMPAETQQQVATVPGVRRVTPLVGRFVLFQHDGKSRDFFLLGVDRTTPIAAPPGVDRGKRIPGPGEIVIDRVFAHNTGIDVGARLDVQGRHLRVVGVAHGGNSVLSQFAWTSPTDARRLLGAPDRVNYLLVQSDPGTDAARLETRIRAAVPGTNPITRAAFEEKNTEDLREGFLPIIWVLVLIAFVIGTSVIGLTIYTATLEKRREYGVLKALGFSNRRLMAIVLQQSLAAGAIGFVVGTGIAVALGALIVRALPSFVTSYTAPDVALVAAAAVGMSLLATLVPLRPVARLDPAQVFRV